MFKPNKIYKHESMRDVAFEVIKSFYIKEKRTYNIKVSWINIGASHPAWYMGITQRFDVTVAEAMKYQMIDLGYRLPAEQNNLGLIEISR